MKKYLRILAILFVAVALVGCGSKNLEKDNDKDDEVLIQKNVKDIKNKEKTTTCTQKTNTDEYKLINEYVIYSTDEYVDKVVTTETIESDNEDILDTLEDYVDELYSTYDKKYGGYTYNIERKNGKLVAKTTIDYKKMDLEEFANDNEDFEKYIKNDKLLLSGVKELYKSMDIECE